MTNSLGSIGFVPANHLKQLPGSKGAIARRQSFSVNVDLGPQESVADRQGAIKRKLVQNS